MHDENYEGPMRLQRKIPWGKRDRKLADVLFAHMEIANPPLIVPWSPNQHKIARILTHYKARPANLAELRESYERSRKFSDDLPDISLSRYLSNPFGAFVELLRHVSYRSARQDGDVSPSAYIRENAL
jgi:hypothetical protein